jgi:Flp pilus assembly protein TadD
MDARGYPAVALLGVLLLAGGAAGPDLAAQAVKKGNACLDKADFEAAIAAFTEALRLDPKNAEAYCRRS